MIWEDFIKDSLKIETQNSINKQQTTQIKSGKVRTTNSIIENMQALIEGDNSVKSTIDTQSYQFVSVKI